MNKIIKYSTLVAILIACVCFGNYMYRSNQKDKYQKDMKYFFEVIEENNYYNYEIPDQKTREIYYKEALKCESDSDFFKLLESAILTFGPITSSGHLGMISLSMYESYKEMFSTACASSEAIEHEALCSLYTSKDIENAYNGIKPSQAAIESANKEYFDDLNDTFDIKIQDDMLIVKIPSFDDNESQKRLSQIEQALLDYDGNTLVIDILDNQGGSEMYWMDLVSMTKFQDYSIKDKVYVKGELSKESIQEKGFKLFEEKDGTTWFEAGYDISSKQVKDIENIYLLTSRSNFSASESFAYFAKKTGYATLVGTETGGCGGPGGNPMNVKLPNTHFLIRMDDRGMKERTTKPDIECGYMHLDKVKEDLDKRK